LVVIQRGLPGAKPLHQYRPRGTFFALITVTPDTVAASGDNIEKRLSSCKNPSEMFKSSE
jgi:hypothetical protein